MRDARDACDGFSGLPPVREALTPLTPKQPSKRHSVTERQEWLAALAPTEARRAREFAALSDAIRAAYWELLAESSEQPSLKGGRL